MKRVCLKQRILLSSLVGALALPAAPVLAFDPATYSLAGAEFMPTLGLNYINQDNYLYQADNPESAWLTIVNPHLNLALGNNATVLGVDLDYEAGRYSQSTDVESSQTDDDYDDYGIDGLLSMEFNHRNELGLRAGFKHTHEARGTGYSQGLAAINLLAPDEYGEASIGAQYRFGAQTAKGRLNFSLEDWSREYTTRVQETEDQNRGELRAVGAFFWRVGGRTDVLVEYRHTDVDYDVGPLIGFDDGEGSGLTFRSLDSKVNTLFIGTSWEATGKTVGSVRIGQAQKDFGSPIREDFSGFSWEVSANWSPKSYSKFSVVTSRAPRETAGLGSFIVAQTFNVDWSHAWSERFESKVFYSYLDEDFRGDDSERAETLQDIGLRLDYAVYRWFDAGVSVQHSSNESSIVELEYEGYQVGLHLLWSL